MQGSETYETLASSFQEVFREINEVQEDVFIEFDDERVLYNFILVEITR